jgi:hypothetical protein
MARCRAPNPRRSVAQDFETTSNREAELEQGRAKALEQKGTPVGIIAKQRDASLARGQSEGGDLMTLPALAEGKEQLQDDLLPVGGRRLRHIRLGGAIQRTADDDAPTLFELTHEIRKVVEPTDRVDGDGVTSEDLRDAVAHLIAHRREAKPSHFSDRRHLPSCGRRTPRRRLTEGSELS